VEFLESLRDFIKNVDEGDYYKYFGAFMGALLIALSLVFFIHYRKVTTYQTNLKNIDAQRTQARKILADFKVVTAQRERVEEILEQNKEFRIGEAYQSIVQKMGLNSQMHDLTAPSLGESVSGKTEVLVSSHFSSITMRQVTDLLSEIAAVAILYVKELVIKKTPNSQTVDVDITVATLEPSAE
jgi:hypothetical protein